MKAGANRSGEQVQPAGDVRERQPFPEPQAHNGSQAGRQRPDGAVDAAGGFTAAHAFIGQRSLGKPPAALPWIEACALPPPLVPRIVYGEVTRDGQQPRAEIPVSLVLSAALQHVHPGLLREVLGGSPVPGKTEKVTEDGRLMLADESVDQVRIAAPESGSGGHRCFEFLGPHT